MPNNCPVCGKELLSNSQFCINCGAKLQPQTQPSQDSAAPQGSGKKFCIKCGTPLADDDVFCYMCGETVSPQNSGASYQNSPAPPFPQQPAAPSPQVQPFGQAQSVFTGAPAKKSRLPVIIAAISAVVALGAIAALLFVVLRDKGGSSDSSSSSSERASAYADISETFSETEYESSDTTEPETSSETEAPTTELTETTTTSETTTAAETTTTEPVTEKPTETSPPEETVPSEPSPESYSTTERPSREDLAWFNSAVAKGNLPANCKFYDDLSPFTGDWKAVIVYDMDRTANSYAEQLLNCRFEYDESSVTLTLDWYQYLPEFSEISDESDVEDTVLTGYMWGGGIQVSGVCEVTIDCFYEYQGKQYAIGKVTTYDGSNAYIGMVRP